MPDSTQAVRLVRQRGSMAFSWLFWIVATVAASGAFAFMMLGAGDKTVFMPGPLSTGHHQLAESCESCHIDGFGGEEALHNSCIACHGDEREDGIDTHPIAKFEAPRNADRLSKIDATLCITCHVEHQPTITQVDGLTQPKDLCFHCHEDIADERPSHDGMPFETCASSGCHNYHDNRALYTKFLVNHRDDPDYLESPFVDEKDFSDLVGEILEYPHDKYPLVKLDLSLSDAPEVLKVNTNADINQSWLKSGHAAAVVNCSACHQSTDENGEVGAWVEKPGMAGCSDCHEIETAQFSSGKHGMRVAEGLSAMTPSMARSAMSRDVSHESLNCSSCHDAHEFNVITAAVEACESCHADEHTKAYRQSSHYALWLAETEGEGLRGSGVSCATCHLPREEMEINDWMERVVVNHNQNDTLSPNSKMLRPVCLDCHGLEFSINALADKNLISRNFDGSSAVHVDSVDMARTLNDEHERKKAARN